MSNYYIYIYGVRDVRNKPGNTDYYYRQDLVIARVACNTSTDSVNYANWQYYNGSAWVSDENAVAAISTNIGGDWSNLTIAKNPNKPSSYVLLDQYVPSTLLVPKLKQFDGPIRG